MPKEKVSRISVVGLGKLGLCLAATLAEAGFQVKGVEVDESKVSAINRGVSPVYEPGLGDLIKNNSKRLSAGSSYEGAISSTDATFVVVPTPSDKSGAFSLEFVNKAMIEIGRELAGKKGYHLVVLTSTVMPGSMDGSVKPILEKASGKICGKDFGLCYNPEFIALGDVIRGLLEPDLVLIGESDAKAGELLSRIQDAVCTNSPPIERMEFVNAELAKISLNSFVTMKMSFANTLAEISEKMPGGNVDKITAAIGRDKRVGPAYLRGATGFGGPCLVTGSLVQTGQGLKAIEDVVVGEEVLAHDGRLHRVTRTFAREYRGRVISITPEGNTPITVTPEHPVLSSPRVLDERLRYLDLPERIGTDGYLRNGHRLRSMTGLKLLPVSWRSAAEVNHGDLMVYPKPQFPNITTPLIDFSAYRRKTGRPSRFPMQMFLTTQLARLIGYYLAEGSTWQKEIRLDFHRHETGLVEDVRGIIRSIGYKSRVKKKSENGVAVAITCAPLARFLKATFGNRAAAKRLPTSWLGLSDDLRLELLRGVMYGDGSPSDSEYTLGITSRELANQIYLILLSFGIASSYQVHKSYRGSDGVFHREAYFVRIRHPNEIKKLEELLPMMPISARRTVNKKSIWIEDGLLYYHVRKRTESMYEGKVYNLEVDAANSYCTQGATLHNCFPRDNLAFAHQASKVGAQALLAEATHKVNLSQVQRIVGLAEDIARKHTERVGVLGLSYKPMTNVVEQSQSLMIAQQLSERGYKVSVFDPAAMESAKQVLGDSVQYSKSAEDCVRSSDLAVLATPWPEFHKLNARLFKGKAVLDCWRFFGEQVRDVSNYTSVGIAKGVDA